nr:MAG TPA: hypothetical protein [Microviridae sp.]
MRVIQSGRHLYIYNKNNCINSFKKKNENELRRSNACDTER